MSRLETIGVWGIALCALVASTTLAGEAVGSGSLRPAAAQTPAGVNSSAPIIELDGSISLSPDGSELTYRWRQVSGPKVELSDPATAKPRFRTNIPGIYEFELVVSANGLDSEPHLVRLEIERENLPPTAKLNAEVLGQVGKPLEIDGTGSTDPEGEKLTYQWRFLTPGLEIPAEALTRPVLAFEPNVDGVFEVELVVSDGEKSSEPARCLVRVKPKPRPPVAQARIITVSIPNDTAPAPESELAAMAPPKTESALPAPQAPLPVAPETPAPAPIATETPAAPITASVLDADEGWVPTKAVSTPPAPAPLPTPEMAVVPPLPPPPPPAAPQPQPQPQQQPIVAAPSPEPTAALAPVATLSPVSDLVSMSAPDMSYLPQTAPAAPVAPAPIAAPVPVTEMPVPVMETSAPLVNDAFSSMYAPTQPAIDPYAPSPSMSAVIDPSSYPALAMAATPPVARINAPATAETGKMIMLDARDSYSPSGSRLDYVWRQKSGPPVGDMELVLDGAAERFMPTVPGDYEFELVVSDRGLVSEPVTHRVQVLREPDPPVAVVVAPTHALPGSLVKMDATQSYDGQGGHLTYRWRQTGGPAVRDYVIDERFGNAAPAFRPEEPGLYSFSLSVFNGERASKQVDIDIEVTEAVRRPPGLSIGGADRAKVGERLVFNAVATDATGWNLSYDWRQLEGPAQALSPSGGIRAMVLPPVAGRYVFSLTAKDESGREVASAQRVLEVGGGRTSASAGAAPYVTPPTPVNSRGEPGPRRVPELTPLPNTQSAAPKSFPQPQMRGASGSRSAQVLQKQPASR